MPRKPRLFLEGFPQHIIQRGNNRQAVFLSDVERRQFLEWLREIAWERGLKLHAYMLMTNHVHLLGTPYTADSIGKTLQALGRRYVQYFNRRHDRTGTLWEGRYRAALVDSESYFLVCARYIEMNPVRAGLARHPGDYPWSSYHHNAEGHRDDLLEEHPVYTALGSTPEERCCAYSRLFDKAVPEDQLKSIRSATHGGGALGPDAFLSSLEKELGWSAMARPRGRPMRK